VINRKRYTGYNVYNLVKIILQTKKVDDVYCFVSAGQILVIGSLADYVHTGYDIFVHVQDAKNAGVSRTLSVVVVGKLSSRFEYFFYLGFTSHRHSIGHLATFQLYWWRKTSGTPPSMLLGTNGLLSRTTDVS
jgi:hypothetical protein